MKPGPGRPECTISRSRSRFRVSSVKHRGQGSKGQRIIACCLIHNTLLEPPKLAIEIKNRVLATL